MATTRRTGGNSFLQIGRQRVYGEPIKRFGAPGVYTNSGSPATLSGVSVDLDSTTADTIAAVTDSEDSGVFTLTAPANAVGTITLAGKDSDGNAITEDITWEDSAATRAQTTTQQYARNAAVTLTPHDDTGDTGTVTSVSFQAQTGSASGMIQKRFPFTRLTLGGDSEQNQSESIVGGGSDTLNTSGQKGASGILEAEILPEDFIHLIRGILNPNSEPTSTKLDTEAIKAAASYTSAAITSFTDAEPTWPAKVKATFSGATAAAGAKMIVKGLRKIGRPDVEQFPVTDVVDIKSGALSEAVFSNKLFIDIDSVQFVNVSGGTVQLDFDPDTHKTDLSLNTQNLQFPGWSFQESIGGMPVTAFDVIPASAEINIGANIRVLMNLLASQVTNRRMLNDPKVEKLSYDETVADAALTNFPIANLSFYPNWGGALIYGEDTDPTAFTDLTLGVNHNYEPSEGYTGSRFRGAPIVGGEGIRQVTLSWSGFFEHGNQESDVFHKWQEYYDDNYTAPIALNMYNYLDDGRQYRIALRGKRFQLTEEPTIPVEGRGQLPRRIVGKIVPSESATTPDEIEVSIWSQNAYAE